MKNYSNENFNYMYERYKEEKPNASLDILLNDIFKTIKEDDNDSFDKFKRSFLDAIGIDEYEYYTKNVNPKLKKYIETHVFPNYDKNDKGHGILHIVEVIRRSFALRDTLGLDMNDDYMYTIAACHD